MRINIIGYGTVGKAQEFLLKKLGYEVFVFGPHVFPNIVTSQDFMVDAVKNAKLVSNAFLCASITFRNKADYLIKRLGLNNSEVARLVCADARMSKHGTSKFGQPYRGKGLPTCMSELTNAFSREGIKSNVA